MSARKKTWREKLADDKGFPKVFKIDAAKSPRWGKGTFVIPAPLEVDSIMRQAPAGGLTTIEEIRRALARRHGATIACPITTGIFAWIAAHAAAEGEAAGESATTPYWRTLKAKGELLPGQQDRLHTWRSFCPSAVLFARAEAAAGIFPRSRLARVSQSRRKL